MTGYCLNNDQIRRQSFVQWFRIRLENHVDIELDVGNVNFCIPRSSLEILGIS
jgi:hypothetical protein